MSDSSHISLLDLAKLFPFEIDSTIKDNLCFGETLIISCGHYEGKVGLDEDLDSEWSCQESEDHKSSDEVKSEQHAIEIEDKVIEEEICIEEEEDDDFHVFFFSDCNKPPAARDSKASVVLVDGMPTINIAAKDPKYCTCGHEKDGKCICHTKLPCKCGDTVMPECTCGKLETVCICREGRPEPVCTCKESDVCVCHPDGKPRAECTCYMIDKPCICHPEKFPFPICVCKHKPTFNSKSMESKVKNLGEVVSEEGTMSSIDEYNFLDEEVEQDLCECQTLEPTPLCKCLKGKKCICSLNTCICGIQPTCVCESSESEEVICKSEDSKSICDCNIPRECTCNANSPDDCVCFREKNCTCGDPNDCKCYKMCDCAAPCICDTAPKKEKICECLDHKTDESFDCLCPKEDELHKLKRVRAGKHGYRWCHDIDPRHTYFDYGYNRHNKISYEPPVIEKVKILGLHEETKQLEEIDPQEVTVPRYKKKIRKPSIDCCSTVGAITISVETLGDDKNKFLVQVVSHSSKEGAKTGSKLVSILDVNLHTLEENRTEHITKKDLTKERRSYMAICESGYYNKVTSICGNRSVVNRYYHSFEVARNFLLEGANVVLMRYFGLSRYKGNIKTDTVMIDGVICESVYVCHGVSQAIVNGTPLYVVKVERHIIEPSGLIHQSLTVLTLRDAHLLLMLTVPIDYIKNKVNLDIIPVMLLFTEGYIVSHEWADSAYVFHINPLLKVIPEKDEIERHEPLREKWREDLQLLSDYLDFKSIRKSDGARYVNENGILSSTIQDYMQALLMLRPQDALHFTRHYFGSTFSALDLPHDEYFDSCVKHVRYFYFED